MAATESGGAKAPQAALRKLRYVGALSSTLDRVPLPQKNIVVVGAKRWAALACSQSRAGIIVAKIAAKSTATSLIGRKLKSFDSDRKKHCRCRREEVGSVGLQPIESGHHRRKNRGEKHGNLFNRKEIKVIRFVNFFAEIGRASCRERV